MKKRKFLLCSILSAILVANTSVWAFSKEEVNVNLESIAQEIIQVETVIDEDGYVTTTFTELDTFVNRIHEIYPDVSDYDIAVFVGDYTQQDFTGLNESEVLEILDFDNITTTTTYFKTDTEGNIIQSGSPIIVPLDEYISSDNYLKLSTNYSYIKSTTSGNVVQKYYAVWTRASWLDMDAAIGTENHAVAIGTSGTFDSSYIGSGDVSQTVVCTICDKSTLLFRNVTDQNNYRKYQDLEMKHCQRGIPYITFERLDSNCTSCLMLTRPSVFTSHLSYGISITENETINSSYAYEITGIGSIEVSVDITGMPSFSYTGPQTDIYDYFARAVTIYY